MELHRKMWSPSRKRASDQARNSMNGWGTVYFYIDGICDPLDAAREWAILHSVRGGVRRYDKYAILSVDIESRNLLDLRKENDLVEFNRLRNEIEKKYAQEFGRKPKGQHDRKLTNLIHEKLRFDATICPLFIQNRKQYEIGIFSRIPNTTVLVVKNVLIIQNQSLTIEKRERCET